MQYNFDQVIDRSNTGSIKWHYEDDTIPLWVADMDFKAAQPILDSITKVVDHGILGYTKQTDALYDAIIIGTVALWFDAQQRKHPVFHRVLCPVFRSC